MNSPTTPHTKKYRVKASDSDEDQRLTTEVFDRNKEPILKALDPYLNKIKGRALEIGSGTGQHLTYLAQNFPNITWQGTDLDEAHCRSTDAWAKFYSLVAPKALKLDASSDWLKVLKEIKLFDLIITMNVIHIAPISVLNGIFLNSSKLIKENGILVFYGPFKKNNEHMGDGNKIFDQQLRDENPTWGVRCTSILEELARDNNFSTTKMIEMPSNNSLLIFKKSY